LGSVLGRSLWYPAGTDLPVDFDYFDSNFNMLCVVSASGLHQDTREDFVCTIKGRFWALVDSGLRRTPRFACDVGIELDFLSGNLIVQFVHRLLPAP